MNHYKHLTLQECEDILRYSAQGYSICWIARTIGRNKSTVSRELKRNSNGGKSVRHSLRKPVRNADKTVVLKEFWISQIGSRG